MTAESILRRLIDNSLDFLGHSAELVKSKPKFALINFHTAIELAVKARLVAEHWSLIVSPRQEPSWSKLISGKFQSVTLSEAIRRLDEVVGSPLTKSQESAFASLRDHRNQMVHFFHESGKAEVDEGVVRSVARQVLIGWFFLRELLLNEWSETFADWREKIGEVDRALRGLREYLQVVYDQKKGEIDIRTKQGGFFEDCPSCNFEALESSAELTTLIETHCLVCDYSEERCLKIECPDCGEVVRFDGEGFGSCECGKDFSPEDLAHELVDFAAAHSAAKDGDDSYDPGNCSICEGYHTIVKNEHEEYICASCFNVFEQLEFCGWCNEPNSGDMSDSAWAGCTHCDGRVGWDFDE